MTEEKQETGIATIPSRPTEGVPVWSPKEGAVLHDHEVNPPLLVLAQAQSRIGTPGKYHSGEGTEERDVVRLVPLRTQGVRTYWGPGAFQRDRKPLCFTLDSFKGAEALPDGTATAFPGQVCTQCEKRATAPATQRAAAGWCVPEHIAVVMDIDTYDVFIMRLRGASAKWGKLWGYTLRERLYEMGSREVEGPSGKYWAMWNVSRRPLEPDEVSMAEELFRAFGGTAEAVAVAEVGGADEPPSQEVPQTAQPAQPALAGPGDIGLSGIVVQEVNKRFTPTGKGVGTVLIRDAMQAIHSVTVWEELADQAAELKADTGVTFFGYWKDWQDRSGETRRDFVAKSYATIATEVPPPDAEAGPPPGTSAGEPPPSEPDGSEELPW